MSRVCRVGRLNPCFRNETSAHSALLTAGLACARLRTCGAGPSTSLRFAQDDGCVEEELALVALDASLRSYASLRMTAIVVGGNEKARREAGLFLLALVMAPKARVPGRRVLLGGHFFG